MNYYNKLKKAIEELEQKNDIKLITPIDNVVNYLVKAVNEEVKQYKPQGQQRPRETINATITNIYRNYTSQNKEYLLLKTDQPNPHKDENIAIFCFRMEERWGELNEGGSYIFIVEISDRQTYILADFNKNY